MFIRCTMKLLKEMGIKPGKETLPKDCTSFLGDWFAHVFFLNRKKNVMFINQKTSYCVAVFDIKREHLKNLGAMFLCEVERSLKNAGYSEDEINMAMAGTDKISYDKTNDSRTLGIMNDQIKTVKYYTIYESNLEFRTQKQWERFLNDTPINCKGFYTAKEEMSRLLGRKKTDSKVNMPAGEVGEINGYFLDDGAEVNPEFMPKPGLCLVCRHDSDKKEQVPCNIHRIDQLGEKTFRCDLFSAKDYEQAKTKKDIQSAVKIGRNDPCPCGSGKKYKKCCFMLDQIRERDKQSKISGRVLDEYLALMQYVDMFSHKEQQFSIYGEYLYRLFEYMDDKYCKNEEDALIPSSFLMAWYFYDFKYGIENKSLIERLIDEGLADKLVSPGPEFLRELSASYHSYYEIIQVKQEQMTVRELFTGEEREVFSYGDSYDGDRTPGDIWFCRIVGKREESYLFGTPFYYRKEDKAGIEENIHKIKDKAVGNGWLSGMSEVESIKYILKNSLIYLSSATYQIVPKRKEELPFGLFKKEQKTDTDLVFQNEDGDNMIFRRTSYKVQDVLTLKNRLLNTKEFDYDPEKNDLLWMKHYKLHGKKVRMAIGRIKISDGRLICETNSEKRIKMLDAMLKDLSGGSIEPELSEIVNNIFN